MASEQDIAFMRMALEEAVKGRETPGGAEVGAVLVRNGEVIAEASMRGICATIPRRTVKWL